MSYDIKTNSGASIDASGSRNAGNFARPVPEFRGNISADWQVNGHRLTFFVRQIDDYEDDLSGNEIDALTTADIRYSYFFGPEEATSLTIGGINIFDEDPPEVQTFIGFDVQTHDPRGRMLYVSLSHNF